jgi:molecular chaperone DnaK
LIHNVSKNLSEHGEKIDATVKTEIQAAIDDAKAVGADASVELLKEKVQALTNASMKIGQAMYGKSQGSPAEENASQSNAGTEEAEFKEKK